MRSKLIKIIIKTFIHLTKKEKYIIWLSLDYNIEFGTVKEYSLMLSKLKPGRRRDKLTRNELVNIFNYLGAYGAKHCTQEEYETILKKLDLLT